MRPENNDQLNQRKPASMAGIATHDSVIELVRKHLTSPSRIVDLAAGEGAFSLRLKGLGHAVVAVDGFSENWRLPEIDLRVHDLDSEFANSIVDGGDKFDAVVAIEIVEHLENPFRFVRECAKLIKPGGLLFITSPNVESVYSRLIFFYTGRLNSFAAYETVRPAHITPIFKWKMDMLLAEAGFEYLHEEFDEQIFAPRTNLRVRLSEKLSRLIAPLVKGSKGGSGRIVVARLRS